MLVVLYAGAQPVAALIGDCLASSSRTKCSIHQFFGNSPPRYGEAARRAIRSLTGEERRAATETPVAVRDHHRF
jgi:hypothetical protein